MSAVNTNVVMERCHEETFHSTHLVNVCKCPREVVAGRTIHLEV